MKRLICRLFGHDRVPWNSVPYNVNHYFSDGCKCARCGALLYVWGPETAPRGSIVYADPVRLTSFVLAPPMQPRREEEL